MRGLGWRKTHDMHCIHASDALSAANRYQAAISASVSGRAWVTPVSAAVVAASSTAITASACGR